MVTRAQLDALCLDMMAHDVGDPKRIQHFLKVSALCALIGRQEGLDADTCALLEAVGYVHDIGIRVAEERFGRETWALQEELGPAAARPLLEKHGFPAEMTERICFLIGHHHTYTGIDGADWQILVEADFLVNLYEKGASREAVRNAVDAHFRTAAGRSMARTMLLSDRGF